MTKKFIYRILAVVAGLVFIGAGFSENHRISRLKHFGQTATVIAPDSYMDQSRNGVHTFTADIAFKLPNGDTVRRKHSVPSEAIDTMKAGRPVTVWYDSRDPSEFVFEQDSINWWTPTLGLGFVIGAFVLL
jgi:hypothetical protein